MELCVFELSRLADWKNFAGHPILSRAKQRWRGMAAGERFARSASADRRISASSTVRRFIKEFSYYWYLPDQRRHRSQPWSCAIASTREAARGLHHLSNSQSAALDRQSPRKLLQDRLATAIRTNRESRVAGRGFGSEHRVAVQRPIDEQKDFARSSRARN